MTDQSAATSNQVQQANEIIGTPNQGYLKRDSQIKREEDMGKIEFVVVKNDKTLQSMRNLIELKNIVAKQLPRMPRNYIVRLIMDRQHQAMIIRRKQDPKKDGTIP